ncbi:hypothetical protein T484DRAFT_1927981 [Baffinella frigidus]|nr:hypothetical protein T484DRAFT_1927981 [Cryptophyta sp. CCMP2293]
MMLSRQNRPDYQTAPPRSTLNPSDFEPENSRTLQPATYNLQPTTYYRTTYNLQPTTCNLQPVTYYRTTYNLQPTTYTLQTATYNLQPRIYTIEHRT